MSVRPTLVVTALVIVAISAYRFSALANVPRHRQDLTEVRDAAYIWVHNLSSAASANAASVADESVPPTLRELGVRSIQFEQFDPTAEVFVEPGSDGQPGVAGVDDNGNGVVDDPSELGATRTDDVLRVSAEPVDRDLPTLVLQTGAFVPASRLSALSGDHPWRAIVQGDGWSFLIQDR